MARRCGWGFVLCDEVGAPICGMGGGLIGTKQTVPRAELSTLINLLKRRPLGSHNIIGVDCKYLICRYNMSRNQHLLHSNADLWHEYFGVVQSLRLTVVLYKVKSHCTALQLCQGHIDLRDLIGNEVADAFAGQGAASWALASTVMSIIEATRARAWLVADRVARVTLEVVKHHRLSPNLCLTSIDAPAGKRRETMADVTSTILELGHDLHREANMIH